MKRLSLLIAAIAFAVCSSAQLSIWDGTDDVWTKGAGTESSPYLIESAQQLAFIASMVNGGVTTYENTYFKLMTNIDLNNLTWVPIGESETKCFKGHFDGNNKTICNSMFPLFNICLNASIHRLTIETKGVANTLIGCNLSSIFYKGSIAMIDSTFNCYIENCSSSINAIGGFSSGIGGIVSRAGQCKFNFCRMYGSLKNSRSTINGEYFNGETAGIVAKSSNSSFVQCFCKGNLASSCYVGGIVCNSHQDTLQYCSATCKITDMAGSPLDRAGGMICFCNRNAYNIYSKIKNSYTTIAKTYGISGYRWYNGDWNREFWTEDYRGQQYIDQGITNSYSSSDKTEQAMKSASFPIVLNTDSTVFIKDVTPNVNDGYPIYVDQVYSVTDSLSTIGFTTAQLLGHYYALNADSIGFEYKEKTDNSHWYQSVTGQVSGNIITYDLNGLTVGTNYVYRVWVERNGVRYFGEEMSFKTLECSKAITPLSASICQGEEYAFNGQQLKQSGAYRDTLVASNGCDSIIELTLTVMPSVNIVKYDTIMVGESYDFYGEILTESGNYEHYVPMVNRCNLIILHLYVRQPDVTLTTNVNDPSMGSVEGSGSFEKYTERTIKAVPNEGYHFVQWNDGNTDNPRTIYLTQDTTYTAQFDINQYTISVTCNPQQGSIEGEGGTFNHGTELTYKANANEGYHFVQWSDGVKVNPRAVVLTNETTLSAEFALNTYTLSVTCNVAQGYINGTSGVFEHGTSHNFEAIPNTGFHFIQWSDEVVDNPRTIILTQDSILSAEFAKNKYLVQFFGFNDALLDSQSIEHGTAAVAPEVPIIDHYDFVGWDKEFTNVTSDLDVFAIYQENTEAIENVDVSIYPKKIMIDNQIFILRGDKTYTLTGAEVK